MSKAKFSIDIDGIKLTKDQDIQKARYMLIYVNPSPYMKRIIESHILSQERRIDNEREEERLSISRKALAISERANEIADAALLQANRSWFIATSAIILSIIIATYEIIKHYSLI